MLNSLRYISFLLIQFFSIQILAQQTTLNEDFNTCTGTLPLGWSKYSVVGSDTWSCTNYAYSGSGVVMSGYSGGNNHNNEDWLISPQLNLSGSNSPSLNFWCRTKYAGQFIQVLVSNNYAGSGNPNLASWTVLPAILPTSNSDIWFYTSAINLNAYKNQPLHVAFKYNSTTADAATWRLDNINVQDGTLTLSKKFVNAGQCAAGYTSQPAAFNFTMSNINGTLDIVAPDPFEISTNGISFSSILSFNSSASGNVQVVYVRVAPQVVNKVYRKELIFNLNGNILGDKVKLLGTSLSDDKTLRVFNWNMRWFGEPSMCACDTNLAKLQAVQIIKDINADIYCLQEVVSINQLHQIKDALGPEYDYEVSTFCSGVTSPLSSFYPTCQKLAFIYNKNKIEKISTFGMLASTYPSDTSAYYCFASGRFPYTLRAQLKLANNNFDTILISNIHAKAGSTVSDYNRRKCAIEEMTDTLNMYYSGLKTLVVGDYNDYLEGSHVAGQAQSPFTYMLNNGFTGITLPSKYPNQSTFVSATNHLIDNVVVNNSLLTNYVDSSSFIFTEPDYYISNYSGTTSDHFGVMSYFKFNFPNNIFPIQTTSEQIFKIQNPSSNTLQIFTTSNIMKAKIAIFTSGGQLLSNQEGQFYNGRYTTTLHWLNRGVYLVRCITDSHTQFLKWVVN